MIDLEHSVSIQMSNCGCTLIIVCTKMEINLEIEILELDPHNGRFEDATKKDISREEKIRKERREREKVECSFYY